MISRDQVKDWLKDKGKTYAWLARQIYANANTVNGWLGNGKPIPKLRQEQIAAFMESYDKSGVSGKGADNSLLLSVDAKTFDRWNVAASKSGKLLRQWAVDGLNSLS